MMQKSTLFLFIILENLNSHISQKNNTNRFFFFFFVVGGGEGEVVVCHVNHL